MSHAVDEKGRAFITKEEGEKLTTYRCKAGKLTIGVGHTGSDVKPKMTITKARSQELLDKDLERFERAVNGAVKVAISQNAFNALISFTFNLGEGALKKSSLLRYVNAGLKDPKEVERLFALWRNVDGKPDEAIEARRRREAKLFVSP